MYDSHIAVGFYLGRAHAFLYKNGAFKDIGTLKAGANTYGSGINDNGQIVGTCTGVGIDSGYLYSGGVMMDLNDLVDQNVYHFKITEAQSINNAGQIIAYGHSTNSPFNGYLRLDPLP